MFSIVFGATIGKMREKGKPLQQFFISLSEAMMIITSWVIWLVVQIRKKNSLHNLSLQVIAIGSFFFGNFQNSCY